jgi:hypothetical protein
MASILAISLMPSCVSEKRTKEPDAVAPTPDIWTREWQCHEAAAAAGKLAMAPPSPAMGWENHYNRALAKCFMRVSYRNNENPDDVPYYEVLYNALESHQVAMCNSFKFSAFCGIEGQPGSGCDACKAFFDDRMTH